jgi:hypothetical protein
VYECAINPDKLESKIAEGEELFSTDHISIDDALYVAHRELSRFPWERVEATNWMKVPSSEELKRILDAENSVRYPKGEPPHRYRSK